MLCLKQFNNFMKNVNFKFNCCYVCNEKKFMQYLIICHILNIDTKMENMIILFKFNPKHHIPNYNDIIPQELIIDIKHVHLKLEGLLFAKEGISNIEPKFSICKTCYIF